MLEPNGPRPSDPHTLELPVRWGNSVINLATVGAIVPLASRSASGEVLNRCCSGYLGRRSNAVCVFPLPLRDLWGRLLGRDLFGLGPGPSLVLEGVALLLLAEASYGPLGHRFLRLKDSRFSLPVRIGRAVAGVT